MKSNPGTIMSITKLLASLVLAIGIGILAWQLFFANSESSTAVIEDKIRSAVYIPDGEELRNTLVINSPEALEQLKDNSGGSWLEDAQVGDYYVAFSGRGVLYRESDDKVVSIIKIDSSSNASESEDEQQE